MIRRILLAISFVAALGVAGFAATDSADAHGHRHGHGHGHGGYRGYYGAYYGGGYGYYPHVYRASYYPPTYYGGRLYYGGYGGYGGHHCHDRGGVSILVRLLERALDACETPFDAALRSPRNAAVV